MWEMQKAFITCISQSLQFFIRFIYQRHAKAFQSVNPSQDMLSRYNKLKKVSIGFKILGKIIANNIRKGENADYQHSPHTPPPPPTHTQCFQKLSF